MASGPLLDAAPPPKMLQQDNQKTMLGVAVPGIAPLREPDPRADVESAYEPPQVPWTVRPASADTFAPPPIIPAPAPLAELPAPPPPRLVRGAGVPIVTVALLAGGLLVAGGGLIALAWRSTPPISAQPRTTPDGRDVLHLGCDPRSCKDGTTAQVGAAAATFAQGECDLVLAQPLHVGANSLELHIDRPGFGRDEDVKLVVPVAYRVTADVSPMMGARPNIVVRVQALPGATAAVEGKPVSIDASGVGAYAIDETAATEGPADESSVIDASAAYVIVPPGGDPAHAARGTVAARVAVAPLRVDSPRGRLTTDRDRVAIVGRAPPGANVTVGGDSVAPNAQGVFETMVLLPTPGARTVDVRGWTESLSPRTIHVVVERVASLADRARALEHEDSLGYDAAMGNLATVAGRPIVVDGEVVESRGSVMLVDDRRGCAKGPCPTRVLLPQDASFPKNAAVRAYGRIARAFRTPAGQTVPEVEADFVVPAKP